MPSSVLFPSCHIIGHQKVDSETREHHSCGMAWLCVHSCTCVRPGARLFFLLGPGSLIKPKGLGWTESTCLSAILKCYLNANSKHIHTYFLPIVQTNHRPKNKHLGYLNSQHHPHLPELLIAFQSSQARFLFLTFKILLPPNCRFNFITNSPAP